MLPSVLRYPGGKTKAIPLLEELLPPASECLEICSPFVGGASFELHCANTLGRFVWASDLYAPLINFWRCLKLQRRPMVDRVKQLFDDFRSLDDEPDLQRAQFYDWRNQVQAWTPSPSGDDDVEQATMFYAVNRCSFSGTTCSGGYSADAAQHSFNRRCIDRLEQLNLDNIDFQYGHFADAIGRHPNTLLFLDPPYYLEGKSNLYGSRGNMHRDFDHQLLFDCLQRHPNWILCYNNCDEIRSLYQDYPQFGTSWKYAMSKDGNNRHPDGQELIVLSPQLFNRVGHKRMDVSV